MERHHDLQKLCKELDPTRSTTIAHVSHTPTDGPMHHITDLESYNHYFGWYGGKIEDNGPWLDKFHAEHPDICLGVSEYGCEGIINWHSSTPQCKDYTEEYQAVYHEYMAQAFEDRPWIWASHVWNMFDFGCAARNEGGVAGRNNKGLVTIDRKTRKDSFYLYQAYWTKDPMVHINGRRYAQRAGETTEVKVYSNQDCVTLYLNGKEVGTQQAHRVFHFTVALAEDSGLIRPIGLWVFETACQVRKSWLDAGITDLWMAVNVSALQLERSFPKQLLDIAARYDLPPSLLEVEVTESSALDSDKPESHILSRVYDAGFPVAIDDFGMGHSSLKYLKQFPVSVVKIDGAISREVGTNSICSDIVASITRLCRARNMLSVAEFVENEEQAALLRELGCDVFQGYLYSKSLLPSDCLQFIQKTNGGNGA